MRAALDAAGYRLPLRSSLAAMRTVTMTRLHQTQRFDFELESHLGQFTERYLLRSMPSVSPRDLEHALVEWRRTWYS